MTVELDTTTDFGARVKRRLGKELIGWLTTVGDDRTPQPSPVWFLWEDGRILIYSQPDTPKLRNIARNPRVSLNLDGDGQGGDIVILTGEAAIDAAAPRADAVPAYLAKYRTEIDGIGMDPRSFSEAYSVAVRMTPTKLRGH